MTFVSAIATVFLTIFTFLATASDACAYVYSYSPHLKPAIIHGYLNKRSDACPKGTAFPYPQKAGICVTCPDGGYFMQDAVTKSYACFVCPKASLLVRKHGYPMCLAEKTYETIKNRDLNDSEIKKIKEDILFGLSADYTVADNDFVSKEQEKKPLTDVCLLPFPEDADAGRAVAACQKLNETNDFLCPYVSQNPQGKWLCRACPRNAPYKNEDGGCFTCPFGEEMVSLDDGTTVCASQRPPKRKKKR